MSNVVLIGASKLPWHRGFQIGVTLDALLKFRKSCSSRGHLKRFRGAQGRGQSGPNVVLIGARKLPWHRGFQIGVTLDSFLKFLKSGALRGHLMEV